MGVFAGLPQIDLDSFERKKRNEHGWATLPCSASFLMMLMKMMITIMIIIIIMAIPCLPPAHLMPGGIFLHPSLPKHTHTHHRRDSLSPQNSYSRHSTQGLLAGSGLQEPRAPGCAGWGSQPCPSTSHGLKGTAILRAAGLQAAPCDIEVLTPAG